jgi:hypothetical protein
MPDREWKDAIRRRPFLIDSIRLIRRLSYPLSLRHPISTAVGYVRFVVEFLRYRGQEKARTVRWRDAYPCFGDRQAKTPIDLLYFHQDTWAAGKVFEARPSFHVDIGSTALLVGILARFTKVCSLDIRPLAARLEGLHPCCGSATAIPLRSHSVPSISSLCVIEHIGLGRYGDPMDPHGTDRAAAELQRVTAPGGNLYVSVPIEQQDRVYFNAHRCFRAEDFVGRFSELSLVEGLFVQGDEIYSWSGRHRIPFAKGMVVGLFHFQRPAGTQQRHSGRV